MLPPERHADVLQGIEPEAFEADAAREFEVGVQQVLLHLGQLSAQIRQTCDTARHVVLPAAARVGRAEPCRVAGRVKEREP
jgi:hypothetical protein